MTLHADLSQPPARAPLVTASPSPVGPAPLLRLSVFGPLRLVFTPPPPDQPSRHHCSGSDDRGEVGGGVGGRVGVGFEAGRRGWRDVTSVLSPRRRQLLTYLALHPRGVQRDVILADLWPDRPADRPHAPLNTAITRLRATLTAATGGAAAHAIVGPMDSHYRLNPDVFTVDLWRFHTALHTRRTTHDRDRVTHDRDRVGDRVGKDGADARVGEVYRSALATALATALTEYGGELAPAVSALWIEAPRQRAARLALDATDALARHLADTDPEQAVAVIEHALVAIDPLNEALHQLLIQLHRRRGRHAAAARVLHALTRSLATIGTQPSPATVALLHPRDPRDPVGHQAGPRP